MHGRHAVFPSAAWYSPGSQTLHFGALELLVYCPTPQSSQSSRLLLFDRPCLPWYEKLEQEKTTWETIKNIETFSSSLKCELLKELIIKKSLTGMHGRHAVFPSAAWYFPGSQALHFGALELVVYCPAPQFVHIISSSEFFSWNFPARQLLQATFPVPSGTLPVAHVGHGVVRLTSFDAVPIAHSSQPSRLLLVDRPCLPCWQIRGN